MLENLETIPNYLGKPIYPGGFPLDMDHHFIEDESIKEIFIQHTNEGVTGEKLQALKEYAIYYLNAPVFESEFTDSLREELARLDLENCKLWDIIYLGLQYGLDPFTG